MRCLGSFRHTDTAFNTNIVSVATEYFTCANVTLTNVLVSDKINNVAFNYFRHLQFNETVALNINKFSCPEFTRLTDTFLHMQVLSLMRLVHIQNL
jgi:hypothetical protein